MLSTGEVLDRHTERGKVIAADMKSYPSDTDVARAARLYPVLGVGKERARALIRAFRSTQEPS